MNGEPGFRISYLRIRFSLISVGLGLFIFADRSKTRLVWLEQSPSGRVCTDRGPSRWSGADLLWVVLLGFLRLWGKEQRSIVADIGLRLIGTGYVISVFAGMADVFGMGAQTLPDNPYFGPLQASGVLIGQFVIADRFFDADPLSFAFEENDWITHPGCKGIFSFPVGQPRVSKTA